MSLILASPVRAQLVDNLDYVELNPPQPTTDPNRIVLTEFFSYQCPHCFSLEPVLASWVEDLPVDVLFERVPTANGYQPWAAIAQAFHALQAMGELEALHATIFRAIHVHGVRLYDKEAVSEWVQHQGVDAEEFFDVYDSFSVSAAVRRGDQRSIAHRVDSVPTLTIDGRFRVAITDNGTVEHFERQLSGVSELIDAIRVEKGL
jgi:thiol:disulfide interchange protein DsbA